MRYDNKAQKKKRKKERQQWQIFEKLNTRVSPELLTTQLKAHESINKSIRRLISEDKGVDIVIANLATFLLTATKRKLGLRKKVRPVPDQWKLQSKSKRMGYAVDLLADYENMEKFLRQALSVANFQKDTIRRYDFGDGTVLKENYPQET